MKIKKKARFFILLLLFLVVGYIIYVSVSICLYANKNQTTKADVAIVLGAGTEDEEPSPVFKERINHAILLYQNGYVDKIIFTGGISKGNQISDSEIARDYAIENGVTADAILIEGYSTITQENLEFAKQIMEENNFSTALIVSDPLHMKRAMLIADDYDIEAYSSPTLTTKYLTIKSKLPFLIRESFFYILYKVYKIIL